MIYAFITNPIVLMVLCGLAAFGLMFAVKHTYLWKTKTIKNEKVRRIVNLALGVVSSIETSLAVMWAACDLLQIGYLWGHAIASGFIATLIYLALEKTLGAEADAAGKVIIDFLSHSDMFDGKLSKDGAYSFIAQIGNSIAKVESAKKQKELNTVDTVAAKLDAFLSDGKITDEERAEAKKLVAEAGADFKPFYEKYSALLNK